MHREQSKEIATAGTRGIAHPTPAAEEHGALAHQVIGYEWPLTEAEITNSAARLAPV
jgi:hypothetical protein